VKPDAQPPTTSPTEIDRNQTPIVVPTVAAGETFVAVLSPTGLMQSSPTVWGKEES
jgi:hypothetical protein